MKVERIDRLAWLRVGEMSCTELNQLYDRMTLFYTEMISGDLKEVKLFERSGNLIGIPRQYALENCDCSGATDCTTWEACDYPDFMLDPYDGQMNAARDAIEELKNSFLEA